MFDKLQNLCDKIALKGKEIGKRTSKDGIISVFVYELDGYYYTMAKSLNEWVYLTVTHN